MIFVISYITIGPQLKTNDSELTFSFNIDDLDVEIYQLIQFEMGGVVDDVFRHVCVVREVAHVVGKRKVGEAVVVFGNISEEETDITQISSTKHDCLCPKVDHIE